MAADLADRHPARIHRDDLVVEIRKPTLVFGDQFGIERPGSIPRHRQRHLRSTGQNRLLRIAIAMIGFALSAIAVQMLPTIYGYRTAVVGGGLMSYGSWGRAEVVRSVAND